MAGHLDFRDDGHVPLLRIGDDLTNVVLGVEAAVGFLSAGFGRPDPGEAPLLFTEIPPPGADFCELRIALDLDAPPGPVDQVPVKDVHPVHGDQVDVTLDELLREEVPRHVEVHAPPWESRPVVHGDAGDRGRGYTALSRGRLEFHRQKLTEGLDAVKQPGMRYGGDGRAVFRNGQAVSFRAEAVGTARDKGEPDRAFRGGTAGVLPDGDVESRTGEDAGQVFTDPFSFGVAGIGQDRRFPVNGKSTAAAYKPLGHGNDGDVRLGHRYRPLPPTGEGKHCARQNETGKGASMPFRNPAAADRTTIV